MAISHGALDQGPSAIKRHNENDSYPFLFLQQDPQIVGRARLRPIDPLLSQGCELETLAYRQLMVAPSLG